MKNLNKIFLALALICLPAAAYPQKIAVIYTGDSYASLYPCGHCPASVGGGATRRAAAIAQVKKDNPLNILIDAGNFIAGGSLDTNSINPAMDKQRSQVNIKVMADMGYEAAVLGANDFNFGADFLNSSIKDSRIRFISSNLDMKGVAPYFLKDIGGIKLAVIGLSPVEIYKKSGVKVKEYKETLSATLALLKGKADIIILASALGDQLNTQIAADFPQIPLIISSGDSLNTAAQETVGKTIFARPSFQAKEIRYAEMDINNKEVSQIAVRSKRLSLDQPEDPLVKKMIPCCFKDNDCPLKEGSKCSCSNPGAAAASCDYVSASKIKVTLITDKDCSYCSTALPANLIKMIFPGAEFEPLDYRDANAVILIKNLGVKTLPAFILPGTVKNDKDFIKISQMLEEKSGNFLMLRELSGMFMELDRPLIKSRIDLFIKINEPATAEIIKDLSDLAKSDKIDLQIHFSVLDEKASLDEVKLALAVKNIYPDKLGEYIDLRSKESANIYWQDSLNKAGIDFEKIKALAKSAKADDLLKENMELSKQLGIVDGNVILVENQKIFKILKVDKEQIKKLLGGV